MQTRRRALLALTALSPLAPLAGCAGLGGPTTLTLSEGDIQERLLKIFPQQRRLLEVLDVDMGAPELRLLPEQNRLAARFDIRARERLFGGSWTGRLAFDAGLRWDSVDQSLRLMQVRVQDLANQPEGAAERGAFERTPFERLGAAVAERMLEGLRLYTLEPERAAQLQRQGLRPASVDVNWRGVQIRFEPVPR